MILQPFPSGPFATNAYVIGCPITRKAAIIDPSPGSAPSIISYISEQQLVVEKILLTHSHWDHIADGSILQKHYAIPVYVHPDDAANVQKPGADGLRFWVAIEGLIPKTFQEGEKISVGNITLEVIHTPGHTPGGVCFYCQEEGVLLSGDTLFKGAMGNLSLPTGQPERMGDSLKKLAALPADTSVFPGHGSATTIGNESWIRSPRGCSN
jgi:hydroxyacylglutathione hydrolase